MLEDRDYMRAPAGNGPSWPDWLRWPEWSWTLAIVLINVVAFVVECAVSPRPWSHSPKNEFCDQYLALSLDGIKHGYLWQLITYQFMHGGLLHIFFNCWMIFVFGRVLEDLLGARNFLIILLSGGVIGGLFQLLAAILWPAWFNGAVVGASAGAFGLVAAFATLLPEHELFLLLFVFPVRLKAWTLLILSAVQAAWGVLFPDTFFATAFGAHVANAAHLGGMFAGWLYIRKVIQGRWFHGQGMGLRLEPRAPVDPAMAPPPFWRPKPASPDRELSPDELLKTQVDPILDKISAHGLQSLTQREREILERASGKLARR